jgi:DNA gyrase inhibitor GyrI
VNADVDPDYTERSELTYLHGVAVSEGTPVPEDLDAIEVPAGTWAVFRTAGPYPAALQSTWAATAADWFPSNPWRLEARPVGRGHSRPRRRLQHRHHRAVAAGRAGLTTSYAPRHELEQERQWPR